MFDDMLAYLWERVNLESKKLRPVMYLDYPPGPGWCFWDETWTFAYGPFDTEEKAEEEAQKYNDLLGHIIGPKETSTHSGFKIKENGN